MVATRGRTSKRPWRRSCLSSKLKSSSAPIGRKDSWCFHAVGSSNAPLLGSTAAEGLPRIGRTSIATRWRSCGLPQSASCSENFVIPPDVFGQTLKVFCPSECVRLIQDQASMRNVDSRIHSLRFDCCVFLFYSFSTVTFATQSAISGLRASQNSIYLIL